MDHARFFRIDDAIANIAGGDHHFHGGNAARIIGAVNQALADDGLQRGRELQANLLLLRRRKDGDDALNRLRGVQSMQSGEDQVAGLGGQQGRGDGLQVAHFAHEDDVGVHAQGPA